MPCAAWCSTPPASRSPARACSRARAGLAGSGLPLDALSGLAFFDDPVEAESDARGRFELFGVGAGAISLAVRAKGFAPWDRDDVRVPAGGDHELAPIELEASAIVTGRVVDPDGRAIAGAELLRLSPAGPTVMVGGLGVAGAPLGTSASDGSFTLDELPAGSVPLRVRHAEHPDQLASTPSAEAGQRIDGLEIAMEHGLPISGRITGAPASLVGELVVSATPERASVASKLGAGEDAPEVREAQAADDGSFSVRGTREGLSYSLVARRRPAGGQDAVSFLLGASLSSPVSALAGDSGVELSYQPSGALVFQVVDAATRAPITAFQASAGVNFLMPLVDEGGAPLAEHPEGRARFGNLRPGPDQLVQLKVSAVGYREEHLRELVVPIGQDTDLGIIALEAAPLVEVTVLAAATGAPVPGARVILAEVEEDDGSEHRVRIQVEAGEGPGDFQFGEGLRQTATTGDDGVARLTSLAGRRATLDVRHADFAPQKSEPFVSPGDAPDAHLVSLLAGGSVTVVLETPEGEPLAGTRVEHEAPGEQGVLWHGRAEPVTDSEGRATFTHLAAGAHRFRPAGAGGDFGFVGAGGAAFRMSRQGMDGGQDEGWREALVAEGSSAELLIVAPRRVAVSGTVYEGGEPLEGAHLRLLEASAAERDPLLAMLGGGGPEARADGRGQYRLENVEAGEYRLEVAHASRQMPAVFEIAVGAEDLVRDLDLSVSVIQGRVTDEQGEPLAGVRVHAERASDGQGPQAMMISVMAFAGDEGGGEVVSVQDGSLGAVRTTTDADGRYELRGVQPDVDLVVRAESSAAQPGQSEVVRLGPDQTRAGVDLVLVPAGRIEVLAFAGNGKPARNVLVTAIFEGQGEGQRKSGFIENGGRTALEGLAPGPWRVTARSVGQLGPDGDGAVIPDQVIDVAVGATATATFTFP